MFNRIDNMFYISYYMFNIIYYISNKVYTKTTLLIYFNHPVGIGDHADHLNEMDILVSKLCSANDKLKILTRMFEGKYNKL